MKTILVASRKGGVGKSTACLNLAVQAMQSTRGKIGLIDLDPQNSLRQWYELRNSQGLKTMRRLTLIESDKSDFTSTLEGLLNDGFDYVFVDTPPVEKSWIAKIMAFSDLLIIPTKATPFDIAAAEVTLHQAAEKNIPARWLLSGVILPKTEIKPIVKNLLEKARVCPGVVKECSDVVRATSVGLAIHEYNPESPAAKAYQLNWSDIQIELSRQRAVGRHAI